VVLSAVKPRARPRDITWRPRPPLSTKQHCCVAWDRRAITRTRETWGLLGEKRMTELVELEGIFSRLFDPTLLQ